MKTLEIIIGRIVSNLDNTITLVDATFKFHSQFEFYQLYILFITVNNLKEMFDHVKVLLYAFSVKQETIS